MPLILVNDADVAMKKRCQKGRVLVAIMWALVASVQCFPMRVPVMCRDVAL